MTRANDNSHLAADAGHGYASEKQHLSPPRASLDVRLPSNKQSFQLKRWWINVPQKRQKML